MRASLEHAEKVAKRLVVWRWLSQRFPEAYANRDAALAERGWLNGFIEKLLRQQAIGCSKAPRRPSRPVPSPQKPGGAPKPAPGRSRVHEPR